jgi:DNA modification methylase
MRPRNAVLVGDALTRLRELPAECIDTVITSPPYYGLRDYGVGGQLGQEPDVDAWVDNLHAVCRELHRVLAPHGAFWLNLGDAYSRHRRFGAPPKSLLLAPERLVRRLVADGWLLRNKVVWAKRNPLPSPARDRLTTAHEFVYFLVKRQSYFFDLDAIREPAGTTRRASRGTRTPQHALGVLAGGRGGLVAMARSGRSSHPLGKNPGDVWRLGSSSFRGSHFATFPPELVRRPLLATCPPRVCTACGAPWRRSNQKVALVDGVPQPRPFLPCACQAPTRPGLVLDPFFGTGTVALVAQQHARDWLGIELNPDYVSLAAGRLGRQLGEAA